MNDQAVPGSYQAETGTSSQPDYERELVRMLGDIETCLEHATADRLQRPSERGSPGFRSASPANDQVIAMFDPRTQPADGDVAPAYAQLLSWAQLLVDELDLIALPDTLIGAVRLLRTHTGHMARAGWIADAHDEIRAIHRQLRTAVGDEPPKPIARCYDMSTGHPCEGKVYWTLAPRDEARCHRCQRPYTGLDLVRLRAAQET